MPHVMEEATTQGVNEAEGAAPLPMLYSNHECDGAAP